MSGTPKRVEGSALITVAGVTYELKGSMSYALSISAQEEELRRAQIDFMGWLLKPRPRKARGWRRHRRMAKARRNG